MMAPASQLRRCPSDWTLHHYHVLGILMITWSLLFTIYVPVISASQTWLTEGDCNSTDKAECDNGKCILKRFICDQEDDCGDDSDERNCDTYHPACKDDEFECKEALPSGTRCIYKRWKCDGDEDCPDGGDEKTCATHTCTEDQFQCHPSGKHNVSICIPASWKCDGQEDCGRGEDEDGCGVIKPTTTPVPTRRNCSDEEFPCDNGMCIFKQWRCDFDNDCGDNSDEAPKQDCPTKNCSSDYFQCTSPRYCIPDRWRCDGEGDCQDGSDEMDCATPNPDSPFSENPDHFKCEEYEFACHTGHCIHKQWVCDGDADCPDHSDELNCTKTCAPGQFRCREDDICLSLTKKCDRERDCPDGSDEEPGMCQFASYHVKPHGCDLTVEFDCENEGDESKCVRYDQVCDGNYDCPHIQGFPQSMDEDVDLCKMITKVHCEEPFGKGGCKNKDLCRKVGNRGAICSCEHGYYLHNYTDCKDINECEIPGTCNQVCENEVGSYRCSCYKNYILQKDGKTCRALGAQRPQLLLSNRVNIRKINPETKEYLPVIEKLHSAVAMDYLYEKYLFWSDVASEKIYRCKHENLDKTKKHLEAKDCEDTLVEKDISTPDGLAVDWIHGLLFWTDTGKNTISVLHIERKHRMTLFNEGIDEPRAIAVDPKAGVIFWTDWGKIPKIERSGMSGKGRVTIVDHNVAWPNGLAVDMLAQRIYWADAKLKMISTAKYDGSEARVIIQSFITLKHPFSLSVFEDRIYWTDWDTEGVHSANRFTGKDVQHVATGLYGPMTVRVYHQHSQPRSANKCYNHKCSHLCLPNSHIHDAKENVTGVREFGSKWQKGKYPAFICACPDTHRLHDDEKTCNEMDGPHSASRERQTGSITLMTIGIISGVAILVAVIGWVVWRRTGGSPLKNLNFDNPVYRQTVVGVDSNVGYDHLKVDMDPDTYAEPTIHLGPGPAGGSAVYNPGAAGSSSATASLTENEII